MPERFIGAEETLALEPVTNSAENQAELMDRLDYKVEAVMGLQKKIEQLGPEEDPAVIHQTLDNFWLETTMMFPPETMSHYEQLQEIEEQMETRLKRIGSDTPDSIPNPARVLEDFRRVEELRPQAVTIMKNEDIRFLMDVRAVVDDLAQKNNIIEGLRGDHEKILQTVNANLLAQKLNAGDVKEYRIMPFEITVVVSSESYKRVRDTDSLGVHFDHSPFSMVRQNDALEQTIHHESIHTILDRAGNIGAKESNYENIAKDYEKIKNPDNKEYVESRLTMYDAESLVDMMHNEILAELENWEQHPAILHPTNSEKRELKNLPFVFHASRFSTAGTDAQEITEALDRVAKKSKDLKVQSELKAISQEFKEDFVQAVEHMKDALAAARFVGGDAVDRLHALLFVLPPSKYRHLGRYLQFKYGADDTEELTEKMGKTEIKK